MQNSQRTAIIELEIDNEIEPFAQVHKGDLHFPDELSYAVFY
jgi:hypothetical protein